MSYCFPSKQILTLSEGGIVFSGSFSINGSTTLQIEFSELTGYNKEVDFTSMMISSDMEYDIQ